MHSVCIEINAGVSLYLCKIGKALKWYLLMYVVNSIVVVKQTTNKQQTK